jgi:hypothetical protein
MEMNLGMEAEDIEETLYWPKELLHESWEEKKKKRVRRRRERE